MLNFMRRLSFKWYVVILVCITLEIVASVAINNTDSVRSLRGFLLNPKNENTLPRLTGTPYLNYICTPNYKRPNVSDGHNEFGYRGSAIPVKKEVNEFRILFLGGSTTYSYFINHGDSTLPEQVKSMILNSNEWNDRLKLRYSKLSVINGGLPSGTSAELLTHYLFKYRYYNPDIVVIHTGGNDSYAYYAGGPYQPDYSHIRRSVPRVTTLPLFVRPLMLTKTVSWLVINVFYRDVLKGETFEHKGSELVADWFPRSEFEGHLNGNAFYRNITTLVSVVRSDGGNVMLAPFIYNDKWPGLAEVYLRGVDFNTEILKTISEEQQVSFCDLSPEMIPYPSGWMDDCHLTSLGVRRKAEPIAEKLASVMVTSKVAE